MFHKRGRGRPLCCALLLLTLSVSAAGAGNRGKPSPNLYERLINHPRIIEWGTRLYPARVIESGRWLTRFALVSLPVIPLSLSGGLLPSPFEVAGVVPGLSYLAFNSLLASAAIDKNHHDRMEKQWAEVEEQLKATVAKHGTTTVSDTALTKALDEAEAAMEKQDWEVVTRKTEEAVDRLLDLRKSGVAFKHDPRVIEIMRKLPSELALSTSRKLAFKVVSDDAVPIHHEMAAYYNAGEFPAEARNRLFVRTIALIDKNRANKSGRALPPLSKEEKQRVEKLLNKQMDALAQQKVKVIPFIHEVGKMTAQWSLGN